MLEDIEKERRRLKRSIRKGELPSRLFVKDPDGRLERFPIRDHRGKKRLTWRTVSTLDHLAPREI